MSFLSMMSMICNGLMFICIFFMYLFIYIFSFLSFVLILLEMWPNVAIQFQQFLGGFRSGSGNPWPGEACLFGLLTFHAHLFLTDETCGLFFKPQLPPSITLAQAQMARPINQVSGYFMFLNWLSVAVFEHLFQVKKLGKRGWSQEIGESNHHSSIFSSGFLRYASPNEPLTSASNMNHRLTIGWNGCQCDTQRRHPFEVCALQGATVDIVCCSTEGQVWLMGQSFFTRSGCLISVVLTQVGKLFKGFFKNKSFAGFSSCSRCSKQLQCAGSCQRRLLSHIFGWDVIKSFSVWQMGPESTSFGSRIFFRLEQMVELKIWTLSSYLFHTVSEVSSTVSPPRALSLVVGW